MPELFDERAQLDILRYLARYHPSEVILAASFGGVINGQLQYTLAHMKAQGFISYSVRPGRFDANSLPTKVVITEIGLGRLRLHGG